MKRIFLHFVVVWLAVLFTAADARADKGLQYWIDTFDDIKYIPMPGLQGRLEATLHVDDLPLGAHTIYMRVVSPDGTYSPVTSAAFVKVVHGNKTGFEYWFDDDLESLTTLPYELNEPQIYEIDLSDPQFQHGAHKVSMRAVNPDMGYSPVYTSSFVKIAYAGNSGLEYWIDDNLKAITLLPLDANCDTLQTFDIDLSDSEQFAPGGHKVSLRVVDPALGYSPVYASSFVKIAYAGRSGLEYWIDDNLEAITTLPLNPSSDKLQKFEIKLNNPELFPPGVHKVSLRVVDPALGYSPVYTAMVTNLPAGPNTHLIYWFDNNYKDRQPLKAMYTGNGTSRFFSFLDMTGVTEGMHHIKFRVMGDGVEKGAVYSYPFLFTSRYNNLNSNVYIARENYWHDHGSYYKSVNGKPNTFYTTTYELDPADFEVGQHEFHVQYMNSEQVWSEENVTYFYKDASNAMLIVGIMPPDASAIDDLPMEQVDEDFFCTSQGETIVVDCLSPRLGGMATIMVYDITGRLIAQVNTPTTGGVHAEVDASGHSGQILIVRLVSGQACFTKKIVLR